MKQWVCEWVEQGVSGRVHTVPLTPSEGVRHKYRNDPTDITLLVYDNAGNDKCIFKLCK